MSDQFLPPKKSAPEAKEWELGVNGHLNKDVTLVLNYANSDVKGGASNDDRQTEKGLRTGVQLALVRTAARAPAQPPRAPIEAEVRHRSYEVTVTFKVAREELEDLVANCFRDPHCVDVRVRSMDRLASPRSKSFRNTPAMGPSTMKEEQ
jgi:hypothetical protein